jgi:phage-related protein
MHEPKSRNRDCINVARGNHHVITVCEAGMRLESGHRRDRFFAIYELQCDGPSRRLAPLIDAEVEALPADMRARLARLAAVIEQVGFEALPADSVKHLDEKLWELRITGRDGISRAIYVTASGRRMVVLRVFSKKTQKTPRHELELARQRAKEVK